MQTTTEVLIMKSIKHKILLTTGLLVGMTATGIKVNANDDLTPVNQSSESSTTTTANSTATTETASTTAAPAASDKQVSWQTPQSADTSADNSQTSTGYGNQNSTAGTTQATGSTGQETTVDPAQSAGVQNSQPAQTSGTQTSSTQDTQTQPTTSQAQTASSTGVSNGSQTTASTNNQQAASQQVQAPTSAASTQETNQTSSVNNSVTSNQSTSQNTTGAAGNTSNGGQTATVQNQSASPQKATSQSEKRSDTKSTSQSKDDSKRSAAAKTTHKAKSKATDNQRATQKTYIYYDEVNPNNPNEYGKIIYSEVSDEKTKYYEYNPNTNKFSLITDATMIGEINEAFDSEKVTKHYLENTADLQEALKDPKIENIGEYRIVRINKNPGSDIPSLEETIRTFQKLGEGDKDHYVVEIGGDYFEYRDGKFDMKTSVNDDVEEAKSVIERQYANQTTLDVIKKELQGTPDLSFYENYRVTVVPELPPNFDGIYSTTDDGYENKYSEPGSVEGATIVLVYSDGGDYYRFDPEENKFVSLDPEEYDHLAAAKAAASGAGVVVTQLLPNELGTQDLQAAVEAGQNYVTIDGQTYMIYHVADKSGIPENTPYYLMMIPKALPATDLKPNDVLTDLKTVNPGVKVTLVDYWLTRPGGNEAPRNAISSGINNGKVLKFGAGTGSTPHNDFSSTITKGIVQERLVDGYPVLNIKGEEKQSLNYLFDGSHSSSKAHTTDAELAMFISDGNGGYYFNSQDNHALLNEKGEMIIYNLPNKPDRGVKSQFFPLNAKNMFFNEDGSPKEYNQNTTTGFDNGGLNHYFGAKIDLAYIHPEDGKISDESGGKKDMVFNFSGDDDFWLFIDGKLVLDIGGIHGARSGSINFHTGETSYINGIEGTDPQEGKNLSELLGTGWNDKNEEHTMNIFYLERGRNESNFKMNFNLKIPSYNYAKREAYAYEQEKVNERYVYADHEAYSTTDTPQWTYGVNEKYGVRLTPVGPGPNPDPDPKPDPDPTPDPDPVIPTPNPDPTPEPDPVIPTPDPIPTPGPETDPELDPILPGKPDKETASKPDKGSSRSQIDKKRSGKSTSSAVGKVGVMGLPSRFDQSGTLIGSSAGSSRKAADGTLYLAKDASRPTSDSQFKYDLTNDGKKARVGEDATSIQTASVLPQTGDSHNSILSIIGMALLTMLGAGLWKRTRKKS
ncbi:MAG: fibro-slime domain-containing protein [Lactobacillus sp.]|nr:MAG: fibro-slime domain-containing protein [Lactobacillus sp.]